MSSVRTHPKQYVSPRMRSYLVVKPSNCPIYKKSYMYCRLKKYNTTTACTRSLGPFLTALQYHFYYKKGAKKFRLIQNGQIEEKIIEPLDNFKTTPQYLQQIVEFLQKEIGIFPHNPSILIVLPSKKE